MSTQPGINFGTSLFFLVGNESYDNKGQLYFM